MSFLSDGANDLENFVPAYRTDGEMTVGMYKVNSLVLMLRIIYFLD